MRTARIARKTNETDITLTICLDGRGVSAIQSGVGFLDHMLTLLARHGRLDLELTCRGDTQVDDHHSVEDIGIALGQAIAQALGDKKGIHRYGSFLLPMDEALAEIALDFSGRPFLVWNADLIPRVTLGNFDTEMGEDFFRALAMNCGLTLHINVPYGKNTHHMLEAIFKGVARAMSQAVALDPRVHGVMSSKGAL